MADHVWETSFLTDRGQGAYVEGDMAFETSKSNENKSESYQKEHLHLELSLLFQKMPKYGILLEKEP